MYTSKNIGKYLNGFSLDDLISLDDASKLSGLSSVHLRHLVSTEKLWGKKIGRNWVTSKVAILDYLKQNHRPGRPPKQTL